MTPTPRRLSLWLVTILLTAIVVWTTWPFVWSLGSAVTDFGDPLFNAWALAWNAHALANSPAHITDGNIFFPATNTVAYSELLWLPSLLVAPILWIGGGPILVHNLLVIAGYVSSGVAMFVLVRRLTGHDGAALVAAVAFAVYPYRIEQFPKVQLALTTFWPLALLAIHDLASDGGQDVGGRFRPRAIAAAALAIAAQCYACVYYGVFGGIFVLVVAVTLWLRVSRGRIVVAQRLALAVVGAAMLASPLAVPYGAASRVVGERSLEEVQYFSAEVRDYARAHPESRLYGDDADPGIPERRLFHGLAAPLLALGAFVPPLNGAAVAYLAAGVTSAYLSLGTNAPGYSWLFKYIAPLRALRVPARFGMCVGLAVSVLAGLGLARLLNGRRLSLQVAVVGLAVGVIAAEGAMRTQTVVALPEPRPAIYSWLADQPYGVVCEYPVGNLEGRVGPQDPTYMYYSTQHWKPLVNGYSGFAPASYGRLLEALDDFPDERSLAHLRDSGVTYLLVHQPFYIAGDYAADVRWLRGQPGVRWAGTFRWRGGGVSDAFVLTR